MNVTAMKITINLFPKRIPQARGPDSSGAKGGCVVNKQFPWASVHFKGTSFSHPRSCEKMSLSKVLAFSSHTKMSDGGS